MMRSHPKAGTQADRVFKALMKADGEWISGAYLLRDLYISQYHARICDLENRFGWIIEHSDGKDEFGFLSYRITDRLGPKPKPPMVVEYVGIDGVMHARLAGYTPPSNPQDTSIDATLF